MLSESSKREMEGEGQPGKSARCPRLIEMVGVAGTGKSTLLRALNRRNAQIQELDPPNKLRYLPSILRVIFRWLPLYLWKYRRSRWFTLEETRKLGYLDVWLDYVHSEIKARNLIVVLDPGSICWLVALRDFGPELTKDAQFRNWWEERLDRWARGLDVIIWMEAPIELSLQRVMGRDEEHEAKSLTSEAALREFDRYRLSYIEMVPEMSRRGGARLFHYRSDEVSTEQMADEIIAAVDLGAGRPPV